MWEASFCVNPGLFVVIHAGSSGLGMKPRSLTSSSVLFFFTQPHGLSGVYFLPNITILLEQASEGQCPRPLVVI